MKPAIRVIASLIATAACAVAAQAAEVTVVSAAAVQVPVTELAEKFEKATGHHVKFDYSTAGGVEAKLRAGERFDLVINARDRLEKLAADKVIAPGAPRSLGIVRMGVAVRKGGVAPDLGSVDAFRASLLKAQSVAYGDPAKGATTGIHFAKVVEKLGLQDALKGKTQLAANGLEVMKLVASGSAELGVTQISEILHIAGDTLVGPLPKELQLESNYNVAFGSAAQSQAAADFAALLVGPEGRERFKHAGFD
jgi:molybdate transport system substrate-binding protein